MRGIQDITHANELHQRDGLGEGDREEEGGGLEDPALARMPLCVNVQMNEVHGLYLLAI